MADSRLERYRDVIAGSVPYRGLAPAQIRRILDRCEHRVYEDGAQILAEGEPPRGLYVVLAGEVEFYLPAERPDGQARATTVRFRRGRAGDAFGEYSLVDLQPTSAAARACGPTAVCLLGAVDFDDVVEREDGIGRVVYRNLLRSLVERLREKDAPVDDLVYPG